MEVISITGKIITILFAFYTSVQLIRNKYKHISIKFLVISFFFYGFYSIILLIYEFPISIQINQILLQASLILIVIGTQFYVSAIQMIVQGREYYRSLINRIFFSISIIICILTFFFPYQVDSIDPMIVDKNLVSLTSTVLWTVFLMFYNFFKLFLVNQKVKFSDKIAYRKIKVLQSAQFLSILAPLSSFIGNILNNTLIHSLMFLFMGLAIFLAGYIINKKSEHKVTST